MEILDYVTLFSCLISISTYGFIKSRAPQNGEQSVHATMVGSGVSIWSATLSVCSGFISSISLLGFPAEIYYQGGMMLWFAPMYVISFPIVAYVFLPVLYNLKLTTIYEYFERRFDYKCRFVTTSLFCLQMLLYNSVALYAPSLAIASLTKIPITISILITATLSALYISVGGAKAGIHTSAVQMALIFLTMAFIISISLREMSIDDVYTSVVRGKRLILNDFRIDPTIRHSVWSLVIGGTGNILALFAANQLSIQRYMAMDSLKSAQKVVLLNIVCNTIILISYVSVGLLIYAHYKECHPKIGNANELLPQFVTDVISQYPGSVGLFAAAVYSAGISTLSASFTAVSSIVINDIWKVYREHKKLPALDGQQVKRAMRILPLALSFVSIFVAFLCSMLQSIILQVSFIVFGAGGGPVLGSFVVGLFIPRVKEKAAFVGLLASIIACFAISIGSVLVKVKPVPLELGQCLNQTVTFYDESLIGQVTSVPLAYGFDRILAVSYQYYCIIAVITNVAVSVVMQRLLECCSLASNHSRVSLELISPLLTYSSSKHDPELKTHCTQQDALL
uniref:Sodium-coupled monocarboxylate transporter 2 n=1 Tax=Caenorhabditis tropicalis TaxID=1561998 RepID=A0A1I7TCQ4_9PELO